MIRRKLGVMAGQGEDLNGPCKSIHTLKIYPKGIQ
jgi:hypothetical protein